MWFFVALIMVIGNAQYAHDNVAWAKARDHAVWFREPRGKWPTAGIMGNPPPGRSAADKLRETAAG